MRIRRIDDHEATGWSDRFNIHGLGEIIVTYDDGDMDSDYQKDFEVLIGEEWVSFNEALKSHEIVSDDRFYHFRFALTDEEREKGYYLT